MTQPLAKHAIKLLDSGLSVPFVAETLGLDCYSFTWWVMENVSAKTYAKYVCQRNFLVSTCNGRVEGQRIGNSKVLMEYYDFC